LEHYLQTLALKAGGEGGSLLCHLLNVCTVSADTLLNLSRKTPAINPDSKPEIVGIDERTDDAQHQVQAIRKGKTYATIIVDLQTRRPVELLADAQAKTVEAWFKEHPEVKIVSRDRDTVFAEAARKGAPQAVQVADRWHLLKNLGDAVKRMLEVHSEGLKATAAAILDEPALQQEKTAADPESTPVAEAELTTKSALQHKKVKELAAKGWSILKIARHLRMHRQTVKKYTLLEKLPKKQYSKDFGPKRSLSNEQVLYLAKRWTESEATPKQLWQELKEKGYTGSPASVYRATTHFPPKDKTSLQQAVREAVPPLSARQALWLLVKPEDQLSQKKQKILGLLLEHHPQAQESYPLIECFTAMVKDRRAEKLDEWIQLAKQSSITQLEQFAKGLERDYQAVKSGLSMKWSNGQVEGQINRLKLIKRQGYGRAKLDLLKKRVFYKPARNAA
jgi:transposase